MSVSDQIEIYSQLANWVLTSWVILIGAIVGLYLWMSKRELDRNDQHKKEMQIESEKFIALNLAVIDEKIKNLKAMDDRNELKSEQADGELKLLYEKSRLNENRLFGQDEELSKDIREKIANTDKHLAELKTLLKAKTTT